MEVIRMRHNQRQHHKQSLDHLDCYELSDILEREDLDQKGDNIVGDVGVEQSRAPTDQHKVQHRIQQVSLLGFYHLMK